MTLPMPRPLAGLKVLELGQLIAGPFAGKVFAEFGAEVIKVEPPASANAPGGDPLRQWRLLHEGTSLWWYVQARTWHATPISSSRISVPARSRSGAWDTTRSLRATRD
jgi:crotonobetainyl-CoA:carnitine CoA-transferase CaiB-like acyl-CoA transferase